MQAADVGDLPGRAAGLLDLHEGISDPGSACGRWPEHFRLLNESSGELVRGRCRATNLCLYCARLFAVETSELLALDAMEGSAPALWLVLTTRSANPSPKAFYRAREQVWKAVKRRWPDAEYAAIVEFTTGYGPRSGGVRRPHWNVLVKGVPREACAELAEIVRRVWCARVSARPEAQFVGEVSEVGGLMRYIALHFLKEAQAPPVGWRGHRFVASRGYFSRPRSELRPEARRSLQVKRLIWKGLDAELAELEVAVRELDVWRLLTVNPSSIDAAALREARA